MKHFLQFSLRCPRCHHNRAFSIRKNYKDQSSFVIKCEGHDGRCQFEQTIRVTDVPDYTSPSLEGMRERGGL